MLSILMPIYNGIEFIKESVNSIISQTYPAWELLIGINGHPVKSPVFRKASELMSDKISVFDMDTKGKSATLNSLLKLSNHEIICLLDVDDYWLPEKLEKQINFINKYDVVGTFCQYFGDKNDCPNLPPKNIIPSIFMEFNPIINSSSMFHKKDAYWNQDYHAEDYEMWLRLNFEGKTFYNIPEKLTYHRIHQSSFFNTKYSDNQCIINKWRV